MNIQPLNQVSVGEPVRVVRITSLDTQLSNRLKQMNIRLGSSLKIMQLNDLEPLLVAIGDARVAINYELAGSIMVLRSTR
ncbi:FeoA family protein [Celerinatantimonas diazotrophica]|nr:FeoA family protein [Celerinatantimonas diazotrophica]